MTFSASSLPESDPGVERKSIRVSGVVQGVGFRPFVYRLASEENLSGFIGNDTDGVTIELEGPAPRIQAFLARLTSETPPLARIDSVATAILRPPAKPDSASLPAKCWAASAPASPPTRPPAPTACANCSIQQTAATGIPS